MIVLLRMIIIDKTFNGYSIRVQERRGNGTTDICFNPTDKMLFIDESNDLGKFLKLNEHQFRKLLHNKRPETYGVGFELDFSIINQKDIEEFNDKNNIVVTEKGKAFVISEGIHGLLKIYTDGSYDEKSKLGAYGYILEKDGEIIDERYEQSKSQSSSHLELLAVINALEHTDKKSIRIYTDSQYVRKGITEWIYHWRENGFTTANGNKAKNVEDWLRLDRSISTRYIEWVWIKGHRENELNNRVDRYVGEKARENLNY